MVEVVFTVAYTPYPQSDDLENVRSTETWVKMVSELVVALIFMLTCHLFSTSHSFLATSERFNVTSGDHTTISPQSYV